MNEVLAKEGKIFILNMIFDLVYDFLSYYLTTKEGFRSLLRRA